MTEKLRALLHDEASAPTFAHVDLAAVTRAGDRRVRRRRTAMVGAVAAVVVTAVAASTLALGTGSDSRPDQFVDTPPAARAVSWAAGSQIHEGGAVVDVGHEVAAYVRTSAGYFFADLDGTVWSWADGGPSVEVGKVDPDAPRLISDPDGPRAAWLDVSDGEQLRYVSQDGAQYSRRYDPAATAPGATPAERASWVVYAMDGDTVYWRDDRGIVSVDMSDPASPDDVSVLDPGVTPGDDHSVLGAADGQVVFSAPAGARDEGTIVQSVGTTAADARIVHRGFTDVGALSPDGTHLSLDADSPEIYDVASGAGVPPLDLGAGYGADPFATGYEWLDNDTLALIAQAPDDAGRAALLSCSIASGRCETAAADIGGFSGRGLQFVLPIGLPLG